MTPEEKTKFEKLITEAGDDLPLVKEALAAIKAKDKAALVALLPRIAAEVKEDIAAVRDALPLIKEGYKSSEFWAVAGFTAANLWYLNKTGNPIPLDVNACIAAVVGVYTIIRGLVKKTPA